MRADRDVVVGEVRRLGWHRVGVGLYRREGVADDLRADLLAWQQILPASGCLTHLTGAVLHRMWLPPLPENLPVFVSMAKRETRPKRPELVVMRHTQPIRTTRREGLVVATPDEVLLTCARDLSLLDLVVLGDSALHQGLVTRDRLLAAAARRRWGAAALNRAVGWMDGRAESPWESLLRVFHRACGIPVVPQHTVLDDADGRFVARGDLWIVASRMLHEYDGAGHRDRRTHRDDLDRDRRLLATQWHRRGYTSTDLLHRPEGILRDADLTLGRRHRADRLDPWLRMLEESLFHPTGLDRFAQRITPPGSGRSLRRHAG
ncbi:hypothetical protein KRR39_08560 [Nocardioides panacis]|uniref:AbiEi antitoxin C-terminal domain-containing protein n=1 Tax=Nocardioides panacis TaxID=2849501 RepID=A0A975Y1R1_9ACTN|nr:hypothetical protein [Nocardioides panacis]QWZ09771.1 hypothetical protein KRR39_08560 [Nocardioides panacis]